MSENKSIQINCVGSMVINVDDMDELQGGLKELSEDSYHKFRKEILTQGFTDPFNLWKSNIDGRWKIADGHQRKKMLTRMRDAEGFTLPQFPATELLATDEKDAKTKLLGLVTTYGKITGQGLYEYMHTGHIDEDRLESLVIPDFNIPDFKDEFFNMEHDNHPPTIQPQKLITCPACDHQFESPKAKRGNK